MAKQAPQKTAPAKPAPKAKPYSNTLLMKRIYAGIIIVIVILLYGRNLKAAFVKMDDMDLIIENEAFLKHTKNIPQAFKQDVFKRAGRLTDSKTYYRPLLTVSFIIDAQFRGKLPATPYHTMNIVYHILACLLLYYLLMRLNVNPTAAFLLSLLMAVHPVNVHAVAWIPGRNDILLSIFILLSLHGLLSYYKSNKPGWLALHLFAFLCALFTKESSVLLIILFPLFMWLWMKDLSFYRRKLFMLPAYVALAVIWYLSMTAALKGVSVTSGIASPIAVFFQNLPYLFLYIGKIVLPFNLNVSPGTDLYAEIYGVISLAVILFLLYKIPDRQKALFSLLWYGMFIVPSLIVPELPAFEHRDYLPLIGLLIGFSQLPYLQKMKQEISQQMLIPAAVLAVFFVVSIIRIPVFDNIYSYWSDATDSAVFGAEGCVNMGENAQDRYNNDGSLNNAQRQEMLREAGKWNHDAIVRKPDVLRGNNNYGAFLYLTGHPDDAKPYFEKEIKYHPTNSDPYQNLGKYYQDKGHPEQSVYYWKKLIELNRFHLTAYQDLANYYHQVGDSANAVKYRDMLQKVSEEGMHQ